MTRSRLVLAGMLVAVTVALAADTTIGSGYLSKFSGPLSKGGDGTMTGISRRANNVGDQGCKSSLASSRMRSEGTLASGGDSKAEQCRSLFYQCVELTGAVRQCYAAYDMCMSTIELD